jgi:hypothetical protein
MGHGIEEGRWGEGTNQESSCFAVQGPRAYTCPTGIITFWVHGFIQIRPRGPFRRGLGDQSFPSQVFRL